MAAYDSNASWSTNRPWPTVTSDVYRWDYVFPYPDDNVAVTRTSTKFSRLETLEEKKRRLARERSRVAIALAKLLAPRPLPDRQYDRDRREGRAVGVDSRYRVMLC